jgi:hypothetical protein
MLAGWAVLLARLLAFQPDHPSLRELQAALQEGRLADAGRLVERERSTGHPDRAAVMATRLALERGRWEEAIVLDDRGLGREARATVIFGRGLAAARAAWPGGERRLVDIARDAAQALQLLGVDGSTSRDLEVGRALILAAVAASQEEREEMRLLLTQALSVVERTSTPPAGLLTLVPPREIAGDLWLQVARFRDAEREYGAVVAADGRRARAWLGLARAAARAGDRGAAAEAARRFLDLWRHADAGLEELVEARGLR